MTSFALPELTIFLADFEMGIDLRRNHETRSEGRHRPDCTIYYIL